MAQHERTAKVEAETWIPLVIGCGVCVVSQAYLYIFHLSFVLGLSFWGIVGVPGRFLTGLICAAVIGIVVWAVIWFGFVMRTGRNVMDRYFLIIVGASMSAGVLLTALLFSPSLVAVIGQAGRERDAATERGKLAAEDTQFENQLRGALGGGVLQPGTGRADIPSARGKIAGALSLLDTDARRQSARLRAEVQSGARKDAPERVYLIRASARYWRANADQLNETDAMLADLGRARGAWRVTDSGLDFRSAADRAIYDDHQTRLALIAAQLADQRAILLSPSR